MKRLIKKGSTDVTIDVWIPDSASTTGGGKTGLAFNTASLVCHYRRGATGAATALTLATQTVGGVHSDGGFVEIDATNMPGLYRLDLSDAIIATGVPYVTLMLKGAANMAPVAVELQLVDFDPESATSLGLSNLDAAVSSRAAASVFTGITSLAQWLGLLAGKQAGNATARTELRATGAGAGTFDETTDSQEAIRDATLNADVKRVNGVVIEGSGTDVAPWKAQGT